MDYEKELQNLIWKFKTNEDSINDFLLVWSRTHVDRADLVAKIEIMERQNERLIQMISILVNK